MQDIQLSANERGSLCSKRRLLVLPLLKNCWCAEQNPGASHNNEGWIPCPCKISLSLQVVSRAQYLVPSRVSTHMYYKFKRKVHSLLGLMKAHQLCIQQEGTKAAEEQREEPQSQVLPECQQLPSQQHGRVLKGSGHPSGFNSPSNLFAVDICSCPLELFHVTVSKHFCVLYSLALT